ncbi:MAG: DUF29 domain-containing protein, partial [Thermosynechococcaceae cyanobacterium]
FNAIDLDNLVEEIEDLARRHRDALKSNLIVIMLHLLKWQYQSGKRSRSWEASILEPRFRVNEALADMPSLKSYLPEIYERCYEFARRKAAIETGLAVGVFPVRCCWDVKNLLDADYLPRTDD